MAARFRIRTSQGQEVSFASLEGFEDFVRSGDLAPDDLVYDAETGEWAPGRTHPLVLEIEYEREDAEEEKSAAGGSTAGTGDSDRPATAPSDAPGGTDFGLSLTEPDDSDGGGAPAGQDDGADSWGPLGDDSALDLELTPLDTTTPDEAARKFVEQMDAERAASAQLGAGTGGMEGFRMESSLADMVGQVGSAESDPEPERPRPPAKPREPRPAAKQSPPPRRRGAGRTLLVAGVVLVAIGAGGYFGAGFVLERDTLPPEDPVDSGPAGITPDPSPNDPPPVIAATTESLRERARDRYLSGTQTLLSDLRPVPEAWLTGAYVALPSDYDEIRGIWTDYLGAARRARAGEEERYRQAYSRALDDAGVRADPERANRLAAGMSAFRERLPGIEAHWQRVEALASAAIQSHDALVEAEGVMLFDASGSTGRTEGIAAGASARNSDGQLLLDQVVELMRRVLEANGSGPRVGPNVREWVWDGFLDESSR